MSNEAIDIFWKQLQTNMPFQITFLGALLTLVAVIISAFNRSESILVMLILLVIQFGVLLWQLWVVYCIDSGNGSGSCNVLAYIISILILLTGVVTMFLVVARGADAKGAMVFATSASKGMSNAGKVATGVVKKMSKPKSKSGSKR